MKEQKLVKSLTFGGKRFENCTVKRLRESGVPEEQIDESLDKEMWDEIRNYRDELLRGTDWTLMPDSPLDEDEKSQWIDFRRELRKIPQKNSSPENVEWPALPVEHPSIVKILNHF